MPTLNSVPEKAVFGPTVMDRTQEILNLCDDLERIQTQMERRLDDNTESKEQGQPATPHLAVRPIEERLDCIIRQLKGLTERLSSLRDRL